MAEPQHLSDTAVAVAVIEWKYVSLDNSTSANHEEAQKHVDVSCTYGVIEQVAQSIVPLSEHL